MVAKPKKGTATSKFVTGSRPCEVVAQSALTTVQIPLPLASVLADAKQGLPSAAFRLSELDTASLECPLQSRETAWVRAGLGGG